MCGIAGGIGEVNNEIVTKMVQEIGHRGPDNTSVESPAANVMFGHVRLSIIDLSDASNQPLWDIQRRACIIMNGEIYNYKILREVLIRQGVKFHSNGDAEVLLNLYLKHGESFVNKLNGIFAFAIWDVEKEQLILGRDHFGVKPLYYTQTNSGFYFASEIKALKHTPSFKINFDRDALYRTLIFLWSPGPDTIIESVKKVPPGHLFFVKGTEIIKKIHYWDYPKYKPELSNENEAKNKVLESIKESVKYQLCSDVPVGAFLSGGVDSSLIVALANSFSEIPIQCFTMDSSSGDNDGFVEDLPYAKKVAHQLNLPLNIIKANPISIQDLSEMVYSLDELQADPAPLNVRMICRKAQSMGIKVLLSGAGGDDIFTGYRRHYAVLMERMWRFWPRWIRWGMKRITSILPKKNHILRRISKAFAYADLDGNERILSYFYWCDPKTAYRLFIPKIREGMTENPMRSFVKELNDLETTDPIEKMLYFEKKYFLTDHNFNYTDKMSMACGVEVRVPLIDVNIMTVASKINSKLKQKGKVGKYILKKAAEDILPHDILYRPKAGFGAPLRQWLKEDLSCYVDELLSEENIRRRNMFDYKMVQELIESNRNGKEDYSYTIFALMCFEIWCRQFIDETNSNTRK